MGVFKHLARRTGNGGQPLVKLQMLQEQQHFREKKKIEHTAREQVLHFCRQRPLSLIANWAIHQERLLTRLA